MVYEWCNQPTMYTCIYDLEMFQMHKFAQRSRLTQHTPRNKLSTHLQEELCAGVLGRTCIFAHTFIFSCAAMMNCELLWTWYLWTFYHVVWISDKVRNSRSVVYIWPAPIFCHFFYYTYNLCLGTGLLPKPSSDNARRLGFCLIR